MMKQSTWIMSAVLLLGLVGAADAQFPTRKASPPAATQAAPAAESAQAPAPPVALPPPVVNVAPPTVNVTPQVSLPPPTTMDELKSWLLVTFSGLIATFFGKMAFFPSVATSSPTGGGSPTVPAGVAAVLSKLRDPDTLAGLEAVGLRVVQSGIPGSLIQAGAGAVGGGAIAAIVEPIVRQKVIEVLGGTSSGETAQPPDVIGMISGLKDLIEKRLPPHA